MADVGIAVDFEGTSAGSMPVLLRPSMMQTFAGATATAKWEAAVKHQETVRISLGGPMGNSDIGGYSSGENDGFRTLMEAFCDNIPSMPGNVIILTFEKMPVWATSDPSKTNVLAGSGWFEYETLPPSDWDDWVGIVQFTVDYVNNTLGETRVWYEVWNEPNSSAYWTGTKANFWNLYKYAVQGAITADTNVKIGGCGFLNPLAPFRSESYPPGMVENWLATMSVTDIPGFAGTKVRDKTSFVSYHRYGDAGNRFEAGQNEVAASLPKYGWSSDLPVVIDEWSWGGDAGQGVDTDRDEHQHAPYMLMSLFHMDRGGVTRQAASMLQDLGASGDTFKGSYGLYTRANEVIAKAGLGAMQMLDRIALLTRADVTVTNANVTDSYWSTVQAFAGVDGTRKMGILVFTFSDAANAGFGTYMIEDQGFLATDFTDIGVTLADLRSMIVGTTDVLAFPQLTSQMVETITYLKTQYAGRLALQGRPVYVTVTVNNAPSAWTVGRVDRFVVDETHSNPYPRWKAMVDCGVADADAAAKVLPFEANLSLFSQENIKFTSRSWSKTYLMQENSCSLFEIYGTQNVGGMFR